MSIQIGLFLHNNNIMNTLKNIFLFFAILVGIQDSTAQKTISPVSWKFDLVKVNEKEYTFKASATISPKWNIYSSTMEEGGPIPTTFSFDESAAYELIGKLQENSQTKKVYDDLFEMDVIKIKEKSEYIQKVKINDKGGLFEGYVTFMCCDHERCLPPANVAFSLSY